MSEDAGFPWWNRISVKLTLSIATIAALTLAVLSGLELGAQRRFMTDAALRGAALFSETIRRSTHVDMLEGRKEKAYRILETIGGEPGIERVRLFNKEGRITFSTAHDELGRVVDTTFEACALCHAAGRPLVRVEMPSRSRIYTNAAGERVAGMVTPIYNEPSCWTADCHAHPRNVQVLGVVDIGISLADADAAIQSQQLGTLVLSAFALVALCGVVLLTTRRLVGRPVSALVGATRRIADGDLSHGVELHSRDELGRLAASFDRMRESLREARGELEALMHGLERQVEERTAALRDAQTQLARAEKLASLGRLSASIAHEINNPLAGILTFARLLVRNLEDGPLDEAARETTLKHLKLVHRETERCSAIVRNLLEFARQRPLQLKRSDLNAAVEEALSLVANQLALKGVALDKQLEPLPAVEADIGQLRQAIVNIVLNACDAMEGGGRLRVATRLRDDEVELEVTDSGCGIPEEHLAKIFDPFFSTKEKGTGLGLSVVYGIVERHHGRLDVRSREGEGTTFWIRLPVAPREAEQADPAPLG
jgi:two-component system NtrC family sensor kinase